MVKIFELQKTASCGVTLKGKKKKVMLMRAKENIVEIGVWLKWMVCGDLFNNPI